MWFIACFLVCRMKIVTFRLYYSNIFIFGCWPMWGGEPMFRQRSCLNSYTSTLIFFSCPFIAPRCLFSFCLVTDEERSVFSGRCRSVVIIMCILKVKSPHFPLLFPSTMFSQKHIRHFIYFPIPQLNSRYSKVIFLFTSPLWDPWLPNSGEICRALASWCWKM